MGQAVRGLTPGVAGLTRHLSRCRVLLRKTLQMVYDVMKPSLHRIVFAALVALLSATAHAGVAVQPANLVLQLDKGRPSGRFVISNTCLLYTSDAADDYFWV